MVNSWMSVDVFFPEAIYLAASWIKVDILSERAIFMIAGLMAVILIDKLFDWQK